MADLGGVSRADLAAMHDAGREMQDWERILAKTGDSILSQLLGAAGGAELPDWTHYPIGDVYDSATHAQYFYHRHAGEGAERTREHGHIHTFMRPRGMPPGSRPLMMPELAIADAPSQPTDPVSPPVPQPDQGEDNEKFSHLVAISLDAGGRPVRLFTTNRWVTGETWYAADEVIAMLDRFSIELVRPGWALNRWLSGLLRLYHPDIADLLRERDAAVMSWRRRHRGRVHVFEDPRLQVASMMTIDPGDRVRRLGRLLDRGG